MRTVIWLLVIPVGRELIRGCLLLLIILSPSASDLSLLTPMRVISLRASDDLLGQELHDLGVSLLHLLHNEPEVFVLLGSHIVRLQPMLLRKLVVLEFGPVPCEVLLIIELLHLRLSLLSRLIGPHDERLALPDLTVRRSHGLLGLRSMTIFN